MASFEFESNDTTATANEGIFGVINGGQLSATTDVDVFQFNLTEPEGALLNIKFALPEGATNNSFTIVVRDAAGNFIFNNSGGADFTSINFSAAAGIYFIEIRANTDFDENGDSYLQFFSTEQYGLTVITVPSINAQGEIEPNDIIGGATSVDIGTGESLVDEVSSSAVIGNLTSVADVDYFEFNSNETGVYSFKFKAPTNVTPDPVVIGDPPLDPAGTIKEFFKISVLDANGLVLVTHYVSGTPPEGYVFDFALNAVLNGSDQYYIKIENGGSIGKTNSQQYNFEINPVEASEANSTPVNGSFSNDFLLGTATSDIIKGNAGNDVISGMAGNDILDGGAGADTLKGGTGNDTYIVGASNDVVIENSGQGAADKVITTANYTLAKNVENLVLTQSSLVSGTTKILGATSGTGNESDNVIVGNDLANTLSGLAGDDTIDGGFGLKGDVLKGGAGNDTYYLNNKLDKIVETSGAAGGVDIALAKVDVMALGANVEYLKLLEVGQNDDDSSVATYGIGNSLNNIISGNTGDNQLSGLVGNDTLIGGAGNDALIGGVGNDVLTGGSGSDYFIFDKAVSATTNVDTITDFKSGEDAINLSKLIFTKLVGPKGNNDYVGELSVDNFVLGAAAAAGVDGTDDYIIYDSATGNLYYDATGNTGAAAVLIANLGAGTVLAYTDFTVLQKLNLRKFLAC